jgi:hypothetical protein
MIKTISRIALTLAVVFTLTANVWATPVTFTPDVSGSSVTAVDFSWLGTLNAELVLSDTSFTLDEGETKTLNFFTLTAGGLFLINGIYQVEAALAFSNPSIVSQGTGNGDVWTVFGIITQMGLVWDNSTLPDYFTLADGNKIKIDFLDTGAFGVGDTMIVQAQVTNLGNTTAVPEPATMLLLGFGLMGLAGFRRRIRH